eukprot:9281355-Karenia_brevis.AAC.1
MLHTLGVENCLPGVADVRTGVAVYHKFRGYAAKAAQHGVVAWEIRIEKSNQKLKYEDFNFEQRMYVDSLRDACRHAFNVRNAATDEDRQ